MKPIFSKAGEKLRYLLFTGAVFICSISFQYASAQVASWNFNGESSPASSTADNSNTNLSGVPVLTRGPGAAASAASNSFRTVGFQNNGIAITNTDYFQTTLKAATGYTLSLSTIDAKFAGTAGFYAAPGVTSQFAYSLDGSNFTLIGSPQTSTSLVLTQINLSGIAALQNVPATTTITLRYYASGQTTTGGWGFNSPSTASSDNGFVVGGSVVAASGSNTITVTQATGGNIAPGTTTVISGGSQNFTATPTSCYTFANWVVDGVNGGSANPYSFTNITSDHTISAVYTQNTYNITASAGSNGSISPSGITSVPCGSNTTYTFTPTPGYNIQDVLIDGVSNSTAISGGSYTFSNVAATHTISATFSLAPCLYANFDASTSVPTGWGGTSGNDAIASHYSSAPNCRSLASGQNLITATTDYPESVSFYIDASGSGGQGVTIQYSIDGGGSWNALGTFTATTAGANVTFPTNGTPNLSLNAGVSFRISSAANTIYIDNFSVACATAPQPAITLSSLSENNFCINANKNLTIQYSAVGFTGNAIYTAEMSDVNGSFSSAINIGTVTASNGSNLSIAATIPANTTTVTGGGYLIRIVRESILSNTAGITANGIPNGNITATNNTQSAEICSGAPAQVRFNSTGSGNTFILTIGGNIYNNVSNGATINLGNITTTQTYNLTQITNESGCNAQ